ncbi:hypothetical protein CEDIAZO_00077 [Celerinatantimonas diazotrophica]|nr:hypothetical protein CEDIAZO_00077 [Celerinatantimonas diazotrophica]
MKITIQKREPDKNGLRPIRLIEEKILRVIQATLVTVLGCERLNWKCSGFITSLNLKRMLPDSK